MDDGELKFNQERHQLMSMLVVLTVVLYALIYIPFNSYAQDMQSFPDTTAIILSPYTIQKIHYYNFRHTQVKLIIGKVLNVNDSLVVLNTEQGKKYLEIVDILDASPLEGDYYQGFFFGMDEAKGNKGWIAKGCVLPYVSFYSAKTATKLEYDDDFTFLNYKSEDYREGYFAGLNKSNQLINAKYANIGCCINHVILGALWVMAGIAYANAW
jgi:hypothetical protein